MHQGLGIIKRTMDQVLKMVKFTITMFLGTCSEHEELTME